MLSSSRDTLITASEVRSPFVALCYSYLSSLVSGNAVVQPFSGMNEKIEEFRGVFTKMKNQFITASAIHIAVISSRILGKVEDIRKLSYDYVLYSVSTQHF